MSVHLINKNTHKLYEWLYDIAERLNTDNLGISLAALRTVLHKLRDHLPINNLIHLSDELPTFIRGILFEAWTPEHTPIKERSAEEFLYAVRVGLAQHPEIEEEQAILAVFETLVRKLEPGIIDKLIKVLPKGVKVFFEKNAAYIY